MKKPAYQPSPPAAVAVERNQGRATLVFVRELRHPPEQVWSALTDPEQLREWAPFDPDRRLDAAGEAVLTMAGGAGDEKLPAVIRHAEAPRLLEYTWGNDVLRWELEPTTSGTRLTLRHTLEDEAYVPMVGAGWHICVDVLERWLSGDPVGRIVGEQAKEYGWEELRAVYAART